MDKILLLFIMLFMHVFADYQMQGILANMKQKSWWKSQVPEVDKTKYKNDYKAALLAHSFEWAFVMMLPILYNIYYRLWGFDGHSVLVGSVYILLLALNTIVHYEIDDAKANKRQINLKEDQMLHVGQVVFTWLAFIIIVKDFY